MDMNNVNQTSDGNSYIILQVLGGVCVCRCFVALLVRTDLTSFQLPVLFAPVWAPDKDNVCGESPKNDKHT